MATGDASALPATNPQAVPPADLVAPADAVAPPADLGAVNTPDATSAPLAAATATGDAAAPVGLPSRPDLRGAARHAGHALPVLGLTAVIAAMLVLAVAGGLAVWTRRNPAALDGLRRRLPVAIRG